jgi:hypothetical protein
MKRQLHPNPRPERHGHTRPAIAGRVWRQLSGNYDLRTNILLARVGADESNLG